ncbi:MAG: hypothetical protein PHI72_02005 [Atribacterota bacterium]|nr:hypothetical protein [Atribacterota bacterium]MDD4896463.1 hypothetical protein [Atribacterota bacterium]MDD5637771.1 hypothetical protein [Atribacterota bacterium]
MSFKIKITPTAVNVLRKLKINQSNNKDYQTVGKAIKFLGDNPRHPGLQTHIIYSIKGPFGEKVFEAYVQHNTPSAYRIFFYYGSNKKEITIFSIIPHP